MQSIHIITINRQASVVYDHLIDPAKLRHWVEDLVSATKLSTLAPGQPYGQVIRVGWREENLSGEVTELVQNERFAYRLSTPAWTHEVSYQLTSAPDGSWTRLMVQERSTAVGRIARLMGFVLSGASKRKQVADLQRLKEYLDRKGDLV